ncbi:MAG: hypothetical protein LBB47_05680 [Spirochaetaceae bacterium]|jgi:hypothetical protein|nr:hypothetical protein [Spirochaetaceae bacterium]
MTDFESTYNDIKKELLPFDSWEKLDEESAGAYAAFCLFRDYGPDRNIKKVLAANESDVVKRGKRYRLWLGWSMKYRWFKRAADYDVYLGKLKQTERRKTIEAREAAYREVTEKMLTVVNKKLDLMNPRELTQGNVKEWMEAAISTERDVLGIAPGKAETGGKQLEINFSDDFENL